MNLHRYFAAGGRYRGRLALSLLAGAILAGCATPRPDPTPAPEPEEERPEVVDLPAHERAPVLISEAWADPQPDSVRAAIDAVLDLDDPDGDLIDRADALWRDLDAEDREPLADRVRGGRLAAARGDWDAARERLGADAPDDETRTAEVYRDGLALHARLLEHERQWYQGLDARLRLDSMLVLEPDAQTANQERIWGLLAALRPAQRDRLATNELPDAEPWVRLFAGLRGVNSQDEARHVARQWRERYPSHPANSLLPELVASHPLQAEMPDTILVLLPLSGDLAQLGNAILDGITRAYYAETGGQGRLVIRDTRGDAETAAELYRRGVEDGVDRIIGPLDREAVRAVVGSDDTRPTLLLNRTRLDGNGAFGTLALNPEEDAYAVVDRAIRTGWRNPLVILPEGEFGDRVAQAYQDALADYGLRPRDIVRLRPDAEDINTQVSDALGIEQSEARIREVARRTGLSLEGDPQVRGDADHLFVTGTSRQMRQLVPYLHFHGARQLPIMATPHIYAGQPNANRDRDLNGIVFPDAPYLLTTIEPLNGEMSDGGAEALPRFVALGMDALRLSLHDRAVREAAHHQLVGGAGTWSLNPVSGDWVRDPAWARFERGEPRQLGTTSEGN
ncbi:penicillin-binding protein activator [Thioalkalivibrio thiocyanoxidans]|uniref:penicillin-binding protein activator n=1 Tax=Thioalkalivibrio thiocyanoxidans TaxID=152475 RepID=UPI00037EB847|nr:penicillin-binding protein activator [Thioalkalivibrio thiocyanoxidans]